MRVLLLVDSFPVASETFIVDKFLGLLDRGFDVHVLAGRSDPAAWLQFDALRRAGLRQRVHVWRGAGLWQLAALPASWAVRALAVAPRAWVRGAWLELRRRPVAAPFRQALGAAILTLRPDLIHCEFGSVAARSIHWLELLEVPVVVSFRGYDLNYHGLDDASTYDGVWRRADALHFLGVDLENRARRRGWSGEGLAVRIPPAVDLARFRLAERYHGIAGTSQRPLRIITVARLHWKKGHEFALAAVRALRDAGLEVEYRIVGSGDFEEAVRSATADFALTDVVHLLGTLPHGDLPAQLAWADVLLHGAVSEGYCNAVLEAQATGLPVVCTDADGLAENVDHGVTGHVVPRRNPRALANALLKVAQDGAHRARLGAAGHARASAHQSRAEQIDAFVELYQRVLAGSRGRSPEAPADAVEAGRP